MTQYQRSASGAWHIVNTAYHSDRNVATCRYQGNLDRPIILTGEVVTELPAGATLCKKCATHLKPKSAAAAPKTQAVEPVAEVQSEIAFPMGTSFLTRGGATLAVGSVKPSTNPKRNRYTLTLNGKPYAEESEADLQKSLKDGSLTII